MGKLSGWAARSLRNSQKNQKFKHLVKYCQQARGPVYSSQPPSFRVQIDFMRNPISRFFRAMRARPRLLISITLGVIAFFLTPVTWREITRSLVAWDIAVLIYLLMVGRLAHQASLSQIKRHARLQDDGAITVLVLSSAAAAACFLAIALELSLIKGMEGQNRFFHASLVACTIPMAWFFIHSMFALHYAHEFYDPDEANAGGLDFPGTASPTYFDFLYFSFIVGTSGQTADVSISSPYLRKIALLHCVLAFFFNIVTLGLTINVASSLL
jgi:uncharacterized membrane protein